MDEYGIVSGRSREGRSRDTQADVDEIVEGLSTEHNWDYLGKQGRRIHKVLQDIDEDDELEAFETWLEYLEAHLKLPFDAVVSEFQERGPLRVGDLVKVIDIEGVEDLYGVLVNIKIRGSAYVFPLCDLKAANEKSANFTLTDDYAVWFANR
ncbi:MAG: calcium-binding protein [Anaerolineales bacterium]